MHYYKFNIGDYYRRTSHLTLLEDLAYRKLLDKYYLDEEPFKNDIKKIARQIGMRSHVEEVDNVLDDFFTLENDLWNHSKADENMVEYKKNAENSRVNGKKGGRPKKEEINPEETQQVPSSNPDITQSEPNNHEPLTTNHKPNTKPYIPYQKILDMYHEHASNLSKVEIYTDKRKRAVKQFWNQDDKHRELDFYERYFKYVNQQDFLCGKIEPTGNRTKPFKADLLFLMNIDNLAKIVEGKYNNG